jgi:hypothetical protein
MPRPASTTTSATASPTAAAAAEVPIMMFRQDHLMVIASFPEAPLRLQK